MTWTSRGAALLLGGALAALLAEGVARAFVPAPGLVDVIAPSPQAGLLFEAVPGASADFRGWPRGLPSSRITVDARGARWSPPGEPGCAEIWVAGDSVSFGWGVSDEQTWPARLGERLAPGLGCRPTVRNWALPGYHLEQSRLRLDRELRRSRPDLVVLQVDPNDANPDFDYSRPLPRWLMRSSRLAVLVGAVRVVLADRAADRAELGGELVAVLERRIQRWQVWTGERGLAVVALVEPGVREQHRQQLRGWVPAVGTEPCEGLWLEGDDHYDEVGHGCVLDQVVPVVLERLGRGGRAAHGERVDGVSTPGPPTADGAGKGADAVGP